VHSHKHEVDTTKCKDLHGVLGRENGEKKKKDLRVSGGDSIKRKTNGVKGLDERWAKSEGWGENKPCVQWEKSVGVSRKVWDIGATGRKVIPVWD